MKQTGSTPAWLPVIVALGAPAVAVLAIMKNPDKADEAKDLDVAALEERIGNLERTVAESMTRAELEPLSRDLKPERAPAPPPAADGDLEARIAALEKKLAEERSRGPSAVSLADILRRRNEGETDGKTADELRQQAMDVSLKANERLQALRRLRSMPNGRSRDVVLSMLQLYRDSEDFSVRADIFRQLSKVREPELRDACIDALRNDTESRVREEAAETLGPFRDDPTARDALEHASENDADRKVREEAKDALAGRR